MWHYNILVKIPISIHSLRVEGDDWDAGDGLGRKYFNPLPPCGGRLYIFFFIELKKSISIHSLRVEGDVQEFPPCFRLRDFNPLPPCGGRLLQIDLRAHFFHFNPLPPCGGRPKL